MDLPWWAIPWLVHGLDYPSANLLPHEWVQPMDLPWWAIPWLVHGLDYPSANLLLHEWVHGLDYPSAIP
jgi:hypothetical protein